MRILICFCFHQKQLKTDHRHSHFWTECFLFCFVLCVCVIIHQWSWANVWVKLCDSENDLMTSILFKMNKKWVMCLFCLTINPFGYYLYLPEARTEYKIINHCWFTLQCLVQMATILCLLQCLVQMATILCLVWSSFELSIHSVSCGIVILPLLFITVSKEI